MMFPGAGMAGWMMMAGLALLLVLAVVAIALVVVAFPRRIGNADDPKQVLALRFARGEIDDEEYFGRLAALEQTQPAATSTARARPIGWRRG